MDYNELIHTITNDKRWNKLATKLTSQDGQSHFSEDLYQEAMLVLLEYNKDELLKIYNKGGGEWYVIDLFILRVFRNLWFSKTSTFYKKFKKAYYDPEIQEHLSNQERDEVVDKLVDAFIEFRRFRPFSKTFSDGGLYDLLFDWYVEDGSYRKLAERFGGAVSYSSLRNYIETYKQMVRDAIDVD